MKNYLLSSLTILTLLLFVSKSFSQTLDLGSLSTFEAYTGAGAVTNNGIIAGDAGTNDGIISGTGFGSGYTYTTYHNNPTTIKARIDLLRVYIHLSDVFVDYPGSHAPAFGSGETISPGVYSIGGAGSLAGTLTLDGGGDADAVFIMKFEGAFTAATGAEIILAGETRAANVFWIAEGAITTGSGSFLKGSFISKPGAISVGIDSTVEGRLLSTEGAITIGARAVVVMPQGDSTILINCSGNCSPASAVDVLGSLKQYALFTSSGAVANDATSGIVGNIGTNLGEISGFTTSTHVGSSNHQNRRTKQAVEDLAYAYLQIKNLPNTETEHLATFGSETVSPGVYYTGGAGNLAGTITLDAQGDSDAIFVFKFNGAFSVVAQSKVVLINEARSCNVFWTSEGATDIGTFSHMKGTIIANSGAATMAANGNLQGRLLSTAGAIGFSTGVVYNDSLCFGDDTPISDGDQTACSDGTKTKTLTASATSNTTAGTIAWFNSPTGGNVVSTPTQVGVGSVTYYAASYNGTYYSSIRAAVTLTINICFTNTSNDNQWDNASNWSSGRVPVSSTDITISSGQNTTINASTAAAVHNLTIDASASLTIAGGGSLIVSGASSGNITYKRTIGTTNWYLVSSPFVGETIENLIENNIFATSPVQESNDIGLSTFNTASNTQSFFTLESTGAMSTANGYVIKLASIGDISFTGTMNTDDISATLATEGKGFNLIGNPYPSYINSGAILTNSTGALFSQTLWVWDQANNRYDTKVTADTFKIAPGQAFFVRSNGAPGNILIDQDDQSYETSDTFQKTTPRTEVHLTLSNASNSREAKIYYLENTTTGFDNGYDGAMFGGAANEFAIYTHAVENGKGGNLATQSLPNTNFENMIIPLGVNAASNIEITFTATATALPEGIKVYLEDRFTNTFTRLDEANTSYKIFLNDPLNGVGRFYMHTKSSNVLSADNVSLEPISIYKTDNYNLRILGLAQGKSNFKLLNMLGKQVLEIDFTSNGLKNISVPKLAAGIYIIQLKSKDLFITKKIQID